MAGRYWLLVASLAAICCWCRINGQVYNYDYLEDDCRLDRSIDLSDDGLSLYGYVRVTRNQQYAPNLHCALTVWAPKYHHLTMRVKRMDIHCEDYMKITGSNESEPFVWCGRSTPQFSVTSLTQKLTFEFYSNGDDLDEDRKGFDLYYTAFHRDGCGDGEFRCKLESRCIPKEVKCEGNDNCGDWSDEYSSTCGLSTGSIIAITIACVLVVGACAGFAIFIVQDNKKTKDRRSQNNTTTDASVEFVAPSASSQYASGMEPPPAYTFGYAYPSPAYATDGKIPLDTTAMYGADMAGATTVSSQGYVPNPLYTAPTQEGDVYAEIGATGTVQQQQQQQQHGGIDNPSCNEASTQDQKSPNSLPPP